MLILARRPGVVHHCQKGFAREDASVVDQPRGFRLHCPSVAQLPHPNLRKVHGPPRVPRKATGGRAPQSLSPRIIRTLNAADAPEPRWTSERLARHLLDSIQERLLVNRDQDDGVHGPWASLARRPGGRAPSINIGAGRSSPERLGGAGERAPASKTVA